MGTTYFVANTAKRQYFDPGHAGGSENSKRSGILRGLGGHALAQLLLPGNDLHFHLETWIGDPLVLVGDDTETNEIELLKPFQRDAEQDAYHIVTEQFDDVTINLIAQLCTCERILDDFLGLAELEYHVFLNLAHAAIYLKASHVEIALQQRFGSDWQKRYYEILRKEPFHYPMPMTPATKHTPGPHVLRAIDALKAAGLR